MFARITYHIYAKRKLFVLTAFAALFFWLQPQPADAFGFLAIGILAVLGAGGVGAMLKWGGGLLSDIASKALEAFVGILNVIAGGTSALMQMLGQFFGYVLVDVNGTVTFYNNGFVRLGWGLMRDFANMGFVVFLLIAAVGIILGLEQYGLKRLVPRIIIVALLVNFSLPLTALVINFSQILMEFFVVHLAQQAGYSDIANAIVNGMKVGEIVNLSAQTDLGSAAVSALFEIVFNLVAAMTFLLLGVVFLLRIIALWVLIILSPLAIVAAVLPATQQHFKRWLDQFTHWATFGIIAAFFMYLATALSFYVNAGVFGTTAGGQLQAGQGLSSFFGSGQYIFAYITILVFLFMSLAVARQGAGAIAQTVVNTGGAFAAGAIGFGAAAVGRPALRAVRMRAGRAAAESAAVRGAAAGAGRALERMRNVPIVGGVTQGIRERLAGAAGAAPMKADIEKEYKHLRTLGLSPQALLRLSATTDSQATVVARSRILDEEKAGAKLTTPEEKLSLNAHQTKAYNIATSTGNIKEVENLAHGDLRFAYRAKDKGIRPFADISRKDIVQRYAGEQTAPDQLRDPNVAFNMSAANVRAVAQRGTPKQRKAIAEAILGTEQAPITAPPPGVGEEQFRFMQQLVQLNAALAETIGRVKAYGRAQAEVAAAQEAIGGGLTEMRDQLKTSPPPEQEPKTGETDQENKNA